MSKQNMVAVTNELITVYGNTAKNLLTVCRVGNERAVDMVDQGFLSAVEMAGPRLSVQTRSSVVATEKKITAYYAKSIAVTTENATLLVDKAVDLAARGVDQVAANAERFEKNTGLNTLSTLAVAAVPATRAVTKVASKIEAQSGALATRLTGPVRRAAATPAKRPVAKKKTPAAKTAPVAKKTKVAAKTTAVATAA